MVLNLGKIKMKIKSTAKNFSNVILLNPAQLQSRQAELLVIDVRGWLEYVMGHIPGTRRLSRDRILQEISKDQAIIVTCLSGHRSFAAAQWLVAQGYRQVYNLQGGARAWQQSGYQWQLGNRP